ncbi:hypothetical protein AGLY_015099 [Aphis glycines]|uniref:YqaJ viral recombinase domain-containing protein n=1 Tax=Aphis glycines TaxID=307491 RepID=A0A6G0T3L5_APHGL|nr:hypothetical protein AGLY_015099 [Aphis glycines]
MTLHHNEKVELLKQDILNSPYHVFGNYSNCANYFCDGPKESEVNLVPQMENCGLFKDILGARNIVAHHAQSLIHNVNNNAVEGFNSVVAKYVGGKRVNFSSRGSYSARCNTAVTSYNFGPKYISNLHKQITNTSPGLFTKQYKKRVETSKLKLKCRRLNFERYYIIRRTKIIDGPDGNYGAVNELECTITDMPHDKYLKEEKIFLNNLKLTIKEIEEVKRRTVRQQNNNEWQKYRNSRLTASNFGKVCKHRVSTSRANTVKNILYDIFQGNSATRYGNKNEPMAKRDFEKKFDVKIETAGLFIHTKLNYLAASPDGLIGKDAIVEMKCPQSITNYTPEEAVNNKN